MFPFNYLSMGVGAIASAAVVFGGLATYNALVENPQVRKAEAARIEAAARQHAMDLIEKRSEDNEDISKLDMAKLCVELGGRWNDVEERCD